MGWKKLKDHFGINHTVQVVGDKVAIGSAYVHDLVTIDVATGTVRANEAFSNFLELAYPHLLTAAPEEIAALIAEPDEFTAAIPVFTYRDADIIEKVCETPGWPNVTHDGELMYENTFSTDKAQVVAWAKKSSAIAIRGLARNIEKWAREIAEMQAEKARHEAVLAQLMSLYPGENPLTDAL